MAYLEITLSVDESRRGEAAEVFKRYKQPFLETAPGAKSKDLLVREQDVQVLHGFDTVQHARAYLDSELFTKDVVGGLKPLLSADPEVRIYDVA